VAENKIVNRLDQRLMQDGTVDASIEKDYKKVHDMLNMHVRKTGKILTEDTFDRGDEALRAWLMLLYKKGATQDKLTSYLRCGLAHLCFDYIESTYESIDTDELITRALLSFKNRGYQNSFFRVSAAEMAHLEARKKAAKKKAVKKKTVSAKKPSKSKAVKKKASKKRTVKKKTASVKRQSKLKAVKKKTVKKRPAAKKSVKKKAPVRKVAAKKKSSKKPLKKKITKKAINSKKKKKAKKGILSRLFG
jgi:flagellar biosynthesis GTPase FlhF